MHGCSVVFEMLKFVVVPGFLRVTGHMWTCPTMIHDWGLKLLRKWV
jgi:hypothetical protein